jgi:hypothetical protein
MANNYEKVTEKNTLGNRERIITRRSQKKHLKIYGEKLQEGNKKKPENR